MSEKVNLKNEWLQVAAKLLQSVRLYSPCAHAHSESFTASTSARMEWCPVCGAVRWGEQAWVLPAVEQANVLAMRGAKTPEDAKGALRKVADWLLDQRGGQG